MSLVPTQINLAKTGINVNYTGGSDPLNVIFDNRLMSINKGLNVTGNVTLPAGSINASAGGVNAATLSIAGNADIGQGGADVVELERLDDGGNEFHVDRAPQRFNGRFLLCGIAVSVPTQQSSKNQWLEHSALRTSHQGGAAFAYAAHHRGAKRSRRSGHRPRGRSITLQG